MNRGLSTQQCLYCAKGPRDGWLVLREVRRGRHEGLSLRDSEDIFIVASWKGESELRAIACAEDEAFDVGEATDYFLNLGRATGRAEDLILSQKSLTIAVVAVVDLRFRQNLSVLAASSQDFMLVGAITEDLDVATLGSSTPLRLVEVGVEGGFEVNTSDKFRQVRMAG